MRNKTTILVLLIAVLVAYCSYAVFSYNNRTADNLSAYCTIDFRGVTDQQTNTITAATLSVLDLHYGSEQLENFFRMDIDGKTYKIDQIERSAQPPTYLPQDFSTGSCFKYTNTLFVTLPPNVLAELAQAETVKISFKYANSDASIILPLSAVDLQYWKDQLTP